MTYTDAETWLSKVESLGGNDFIPWEELEGETSHETRMYMTYMVGHFNQKAIFGNVDDGIVAYTRRLLKESIEGTGDAEVVN